MNFKDIAGLQYKNISDDVLSFRRAKTANTNKSQSHVKVYLNEFNKNVIEKYGNPNKKTESYIFQIIDPTSSAEKKHSDLRNYIRFINQHFGKYAKTCGIQDSVSTYWARHTFATTAIRNGASMEYVSEALNHSNLSTTKIYFAGFDDEKKRQISNKLMEF
jgi:site-specific recombinase XerD